ncbi:MAG: HIT family protein [Alphaproteobacteria bacterium]|nr:HIT family protein [Rhodospirillaceae bacterium]MDP6020509.1 HIT family protein [Alphaproteobacteria bacterium]MDP6254253.1 HIT family protein [Alphaproteobacteria bacterium]MDP7052669.1 HIT family protein [Alphaproteobacteria bacterium]MDP7229787.1 HIT family protein [Alphaproteobacteria bacterium]
MIAANPNCQFCTLPLSRCLRESDTCFTIHDAYPVTPLHTLIIPKRHVETYFDLNLEERRDVERHLMAERRAIITADCLVTGFNIGINCGEAAGQTVMHCHIHLIPRRSGDMDDPRGGVRGVLPDKRIY